MGVKYQGGYTGEKPGWSRERQSGVWNLYDLFVGVETRSLEVVVDAGATVVDQIELMEPALIRSVRLTKAGWIRFFDSEAARERDAPRLVTEDPPSGSGVVLEVRTPADNTVNMAPVVFFVARQPELGAFLPFRLTNESTSADMTLEITFIPVLRPA